MCLESDIALLGFFFRRMVKFNTMEWLSLKRVFLMVSLIMLGQYTLKWDPIASPTAL